MSLRDYEVPRDKFEWERPYSESGFSFPCSVCKHRFGEEFDEPCRTCDHNASAVKDDPPNPTLEARTTAKD